MSGYTQIIKQLLWEQYDDPQSQTIVISTFNIKFISPKAQLLLESYSHLTSLTITKCDLRKLENFPVLPQLTDLDLSSNSLQGTFNYLMPLSALRYLNIAQNIVADYRALEPLRRLRKLEVHLKDNPFTELPSWKGKLKLLGITVLKDPKPLGKQDVKQEDLSEQEKERLEESKKQVVKLERRPFNFAQHHEQFISGLAANIDQDFFDAPIPEIPYPPSGFLIEAASHHANNLMPVDNLEFEEGGSELNIEMENNEDEELALEVEEVEEFVGEEAEEGDEQEDEPYY